VLPLSVLSLVLLGGFIFVTQWYPTRYYTLRSEGYRLVFLSAIFGAVFLLLSYYLVEATASTGVSEFIAGQWTEHVLSTSLEGLDRALVAFLLGASLWIPSNFLGKLSLWLQRRKKRILNWLGRRFRFLSDEAAIERAIESKQDPLEMFLHHAIYRPSRERNVAITVKNSKVYVGLLQEIFNPAFPLTSIGMILSRSGHREASNQQMKIDIDYAQTVRDKLTPDLMNRRLEELRKEKPDIDDYKRLNIVTSEFIPPGENPLLVRETGARLANYQMVIPLAEVQSVSFFDEDVYEDYSKSFTTAP
jgi:hypothetical protein